MPAVSPQDQPQLVNPTEISLPQNCHSSSREVEQRVMMWSWIVVSIFGFFQAMAGRFYMNPDGVSYSDLADAYSRADWHSAISPYWSPLYPFLLSIAFRLVHPSAYFEPIAIHLLNFLLYLVCFACLQLFIFEIAMPRDVQSVNGGVRFSRPALLAFGAVAFLTLAQHYLPLSLVTPDLCVLAVALLASTAVLRLERLGINNGRLIGLGIILAIGYLAKAAFFPVAFVFMAAALARKTALRTLLVRSCVVTAAFFAIAGPNILAVSKIKHSITFADTGKLNYLWFVNGMSSIHFEVPGNTQGLPIHPSRKIFDNPNVYEFASPVRGTYPVWFNPSYWNEGVSPRFDLEQQLNAIRATSYAYKAMFSKASEFFFAWLLLAVLQYQSGLSLLTNLQERWRILVPSLAALAVYWPVFVEGRYIAGFILIIWIAMYSSIRLPDNRVSGNLLSATVTVLAVAMLITLYPQLHDNVEASSQPMPNPQWEVAKALHRDFGLQDNDSVGCIGHCFFSYWARLAHLKIVTEIPSHQAFVFHSSSPSTRLTALRSMAATGAKVVLTPINFGDGWERVGQTDYFLYDLRSLGTGNGTR